MVGRTATRSPRNGLPRSCGRPRKLIVPSHDTLRTASRGADSTRAGTSAVNVAHRIRRLAGTAIPNASWGRSWLLDATFGTGGQVSPSLLGGSSQIIGSTGLTIQSNGDILLSNGVVYPSLSIYTGGADRSNRLWHSARSAKWRPWITSAFRVR